MYIEQVAVLLSVIPVSTVFEAPTMVTLHHSPAIIMVTAFGREEVREETGRLHLDGFFIKPVTKSTVVDA
jgi:hypothetical protein